MTRLIETAAIFQQEDPATHDDAQPDRCQHRDWDRSICDWVRCSNSATQDRLDFGRPIRVCDEDAVYYDDTPRHNHFDDRDARDDCPACLDLIRQAGG